MCTPNLLVAIVTEFSLQNELTPLLLASGEGKTKVVKLLIKYGAQLDIRNKVTFGELNLMYLVQLAYYSPFRREGQLYLRQAGRDTRILSGY